MRRSPWLAGEQLTQADDDADESFCVTVPAILGPKPSESHPTKESPTSSSRIEAFSASRLQPDHWLGPLWALEELNL